jgi:PqqD family protein of HPr-rel-A system
MKMWRLNLEHTLHFRSWDGDWVIYDSFSGDTHLLGETAVQLLQQLQKSPLSSRALADLLALENVCLINEQFTAEMEFILGELEELGLVEVCE